METQSCRRGKKRLFSRVLDMPYGHTNQFHLFDAAKNSKQLVQKLQLQTKIPVHNGCVNSICWNDTGKYLLSGSDDQKLSIVHGYDYSIMAYIATGHRANIFSAKYLPNTNDSHIVSCSGDGIIIYSILERPETSMNNKFNCHVGTAYEIMTVPNDPNTFLSCGEDRTVRWFDLRTKSSCMNSNCKDDVLINCRSPVTSLAINPLTPYQLAAGCADASVRLFDRRMLGTRATGNVSSNGFQALMACFTVPDFTQSRRITSLCYSLDGEEVLVSYSSDYIYLFDVRDDLEKSPRVLSTDSLDENSDNNSSLCYQGRSLMKRLRVRGDWSDTGPNARPEAESRGEEQPETRTRATRMRWMTEVLTRMFNHNTNRTRSSVAQSSSASQQSENTEAVTADGNEEQTDTTRKEPEKPKEEAKSDSSDSEPKPSTSKTSKSATRNLTEKTKDKLKSIACCALGEPEASTSSQDPVLEDSESENASEEAPGDTMDETHVTEATMESEPVDSNTNEDSQESIYDGSENYRHQMEPIINLICHDDSFLGDSIFSPGTMTIELPPKKIAPQAINDSKSQGHGSGSGGSNVESADSAGKGEVSSHDVTDDSATRAFAAVNASPTPLPLEPSDNEVDEAIQSIEPNIPLVFPTSDDVQIGSAEGEVAEGPSNNLEEGNVALMMEADSWDLDSDEDLAIPTQSSPQSGTSGRATGDSGEQETIFESLADEVKSRNEDLLREVVHIDNVAYPRVKRKYTGHRNARTMIKEATFWGNNFVMSGSDCGHIFIWDRLTTELVMMMEADHHVVNCLQPHPFDPVLASSGIDYDIKLWAPTREEPHFDVEKANEMIKRNEVMLEETKDTITVPASFMIRMLDTLNHFRFGHGYSWSRAARDARAAANSESSNR